MNTVVHLRKLCNHPFLFETVEQECAAYWKEEMTELVLLFCRHFIEKIVNTFQKAPISGGR